MASLAILLILLAFTALGVAVAVFASSAVLERYWWRRVASHVDGRLTALGLRWDRREAWRGTWKGRTVAARLYPTDSGVGLRIYMRVPTGSLAVRRRGWSTAAPWSRAVRTGAAAFDKLFAVSGSGADRSFLTHEVRRRLGDLAGTIQLRSGWLTWDEVSPIAARPQDLHDRLQCLVGLSNVLWAVPSDPMDRLEHAVLRDPDWAVRWRTLVALDQQAPAQAERLAFRALNDPDPHVRWAAARVSGAVGSLARLCVSSRLPLVLRRAAGADLLGTPSSARHLAVARALASAPEPSMRRLAARLASREGRAGSTVLNRLLGCREASVLRLAARGLARCGSLECARPLKARMELLSPLNPLRAELWFAWRSVMARCSARAGALAVTHADGGELTLVGASSVASGAAAARS